MTTPTSEILNKAADLIEERGWTQGHWNTESDTAPMCLEGGIIVAAGLSDATVGSLLLETCPAARAVHDYLAIEWHNELWRWNDDALLWSGGGAASAERVIEVLRSAALIEAARENSSVTEEVST